MFTIKADDLSAILDKVEPHQTDENPMIVLDHAYGWLHAAAAGPQTVAVARTRSAGKEHWIAPLTYDEAFALRAWLGSCTEVDVEYEVDSGHPLLHFVEGEATMTLPVSSHLPELPWRTMVQMEVRAARPTVRPALLSSDDLKLWSRASEEVTIWPAAGLAAFVVTAPHFIGLQFPSGASPEEDQEALDGWGKSLRRRRFLHDGLPYEIGATYLDRRGKVWRITARPGPGEEPVAVSAETSGEALPLSEVLREGGSLMRIQ